jgi:hypothetical protein
MVYLLVAPPTFADVDVEGDEFAKRLSILRLAFVRRTREKRTEVSRPRRL